MISPNYILIFLIGFLVGAGLIAVIAWYLNFKKLNNVQNPRDELIALRTEMNTINNTIDSFKAAQELRAGTFNEQVRNLIDAGIKINDTANRFQNTLIKGGSQQQGALGELILKKILESIGFREGEEFETQKAFKDNDGKIQKPDVIVHMPGNRDIIIDS